ncbi:hypothetical protein [Deferribacter abyssi]|uniref:hypothetical protein n=1 Tax=Deferribacter abyssi TaxID=213806 RepID=UPI003C295E31
MEKIIKITPQKYYREIICDCCNKPLYLPDFEEEKEWEDFYGTFWIEPDNVWFEKCICEDCRRKYWKNFKIEHDDKLLNFANKVLIESI